MTDDELVTQFHEMWDGFPGLARLIDSHHAVIASNPAAQERGFVEGATCAKIGDPELHRECKLATFFKSGEAITDHVIDDRVRGWMPVEGRPDVCIHFAVMIPQ